MRPLNKEKKIYTSYYAISGKHPDAISISNTAPSFFKGGALPQLAPAWSLVVARRAERTTDDEFAKEYIRRLDEDLGLTAEAIYDLIPDGAVLLCYEKTGDFCHRHVLAEFLEKHLDVKIEEIVKEPKDPKTHNTDLFEY